MQNRIRSQGFAPLMLIDIERLDLGDQARFLSCLLVSIPGELRKSFGFGFRPGPLARRQIIASAGK